CGALGEVWCPKCQATVRIIGKPMCSLCGLPLRSAKKCLACALHDYKFTASRAWGAYRGELRQAILHLKHRRNASLGQSLARNLWQVYMAQDWDIDCLIPVPLGYQRMQQRGYNQVDILARPFASMAGLPYAESVLIRRHETLPQFELNAAERWENLHGSFVADPEPLKGMRVLVIDDIMTTGATLDSAAEALREAGATQVYAITLARTIPEANN
ncbi:MAG: ComF family protein, partial [Anaerolineales bacterium]